MRATVILLISLHIKNPRKFLGIIDIVKFCTAYENDMIPNKILVEVPYAYAVQSAATRRSAPANIEARSCTSLICTGHWRSRDGTAAEFSCASARSIAQLFSPAFPAPVFSCPAASFAFRWFSFTASSSYGSASRSTNEIASAGQTGSSHRIRRSSHPGSALPSRQPSQSHFMTGMRTKPASCTSVFLYLNNFSNHH